MRSCNAFCRGCWLGFYHVANRVNVDVVMTIDAGRTDLKCVRKARCEGSHSANDCSRQVAKSALPACRLANSQRSGRV